MMVFEDLKQLSPIITKNLPFFGLVGVFAFIFFMEFPLFVVAGVAVAIAIFFIKNKYQGAY